MRHQEFDLCSLDNMNSKVAPCVCLCMDQLGWHTEARFHIPLNNFGRGRTGSIHPLMACGSMVLATWPIPTPQIIEFPCFFTPAHIAQPWLANLFARRFIIIIIIMSPLIFPLSAPSKVQVSSFMLSLPPLPSSSSSSSPPFLTHKKTRRGLYVPSSALHCIMEREPLWRADESF